MTEQPTPCPICGHDAPAGGLCLVCVGQDRKGSAVTKHTCLEEDRLRVITPKGIVGIFTTPKGEVIASVTVFEQAHPGGWRLIEAQKSLAARRLALAVARAYCAPDYADATSEYDREKTMNTLRGKGFKASYIPVGYEGEGEV